MASVFRLTHKYYIQYCRRHVVGKNPVVSTQALSPCRSVIFQLTYKNKDRLEGGERRLDSKVCQETMNRSRKLQPALALSITDRGLQATTEPLF